MVRRKKDSESERDQQFKVEGESAEIMEKKDTTR